MDNNNNNNEGIRKNNSDVNLYSLTSTLNSIAPASNLLSIRKGNKSSYLNEKTPEDIEKETRVIEGIDKEYFSEEFDIGYLLDQIPLPKGGETPIDAIDRLSVQIYGYHEVVDSRFNDLIMKSYNGFVQGMSQVYEIEKDLKQSAVMCKSGKDYLGKVQKGLTAFGMVLLQKYRKRELYKYLLAEIERIRDISDASKLIDRLLEHHNFPEAIILRQKSSKKIISSSQYQCLSDVTTSFELSTQLILDKVDSSFLEVCHIFKEKIFENIILGYLMLDQKQRFKEKIHQNFILNIEDHTKRLLRTHLQQGHRNPEELKAMKFVEMCKILKEDHYVTALLGVLEHLSDLMCSHYQMRQWMLKRLNETKDNNVNDKEEREFYIEIFKYMFSNKRTMWNTIQNQIKHILGSCSPSFKIEEFLKVLESINQFIDIGHEFANEEREGTQGQASSLLRTAMREQSLAYFENFHKKRIEDLRTMLENEMWQKVPLTNNFTVLDIQEFGGVMSSSTPLTRSTSSLSMPRSTSTPAGLSLLTLNLDQKPVSLDMADHDIPFFNQFKQVGNPFKLKEERRKTLNEIAGDRFEDTSSSSNGSSNGHNGHNNSNGHQQVNNTGTPLISSTTINVVRLIGKYLQMMKILKQLAYPIFTAISQLLEYYVYTVYTFFGEQQSSSSFNDDSISNISPILKKTMQRLKVKFNATSTTNTPSTLTSTTSSILSSTHLFQSKLSSSPISLRSSSNGSSLDSNKSPQMSHLSLQPNDDVISIQWSLPTLSELVDLSNSKTLYGLEYRVIGLESMMFIVDAIMEAQPLVFNLIPNDRLDSISLFYSETVSVVSALRSVCYKNIASQVLNFDQIYTMISNVKWEPKDIQSEPSPYVKQLIIDLHQFAGHLNEIETRSGVITQKVKGLLWENTITFAMEALIEAYSRIKKCNNNGRTQMTEDLNRLQPDIESLTTIRPIPHMQAVFKYIKAYYLPDTDIFNLARDEDYTVKQVIGIVNVVNHLKKPQKQKLLQDLDDLEKSRRIFKN